MFSALASRLVIVVAITTAAIAGCASAGSIQPPRATLAPVPTSVAPTPVPTIGAPTPPPSTAGDPETQAVITTPAEAVARVAAREPRFAGIGPFEPDLIGQSSWYTVEPALGAAAYVVTFRIGWGDCPSGCIEEHSWIYEVARDGTVTLTAETGDPGPPVAAPSPIGEGSVAPLENDAGIR